MNKGRYVFSQVLDFLPRFQFDRLATKYRGDWHSKDLTCYNQFLHLLFGQLTGCDSVRDICLCLGAHENILYHLGFRNTVNQSSLMRANEKRDFRIYEEFGTLLIDIVRPLYSREKVSEITIDNVLYALDSTTISTGIKLAAWALGKYSKGRSRCIRCSRCVAASPQTSISLTGNGTTAMNWITLNQNRLPST